VRLEAAEGRRLTYSQAISEGLVQAMEQDDSVFLYGIGVGDPKGIFGTTTEALKRFGPTRVFDTPVSENALTGLAIGAALTGLRPVLVHARNDFMYYCLDQMANHAAKWFYMFGGRMRVPLVVRAIVGKGWGQGAQHSQSLHAIFGHIPNLNVILPATPRDAKGACLTATRNFAPTVIIEHRRLYDTSGPVPTKPYRLPVGKGRILRSGNDVSIVAFSLMVPMALEAAEILAPRGIDVEVIDPCWIKPLDEALILGSVRKTGRLVVADTSWKSYGASAEIAAIVSEKAFESLKAPIGRIALPDIPAPTTEALEQLFYPNLQDIMSLIEKTVGKEPQTRHDTKPIRKRRRKEFVGPF
jgi:pyruvate/2-oxoglutarate/acetoin dehydrogenase E1 component